MNERDEAGGIAFENIAGMLRRRLPLILTAVGVAVGAALVFSLFKDKEYTSSASMVLQSSGSDPLASPFASSATADQRTAATSLVLAARDVIAPRPATRLPPAGG